MTERKHPRTGGRRSLGPWEPFRSFHPFASGSIRRLAEAYPGAAPSARGRPGFAPALDLVEHPDHYSLNVELPGVRREAVSVEVHGRTLSVRGEKRREREERSLRVHSVERSFGFFARSITLPHDADPEGLEASFSDGLLTVRIRKLPSPQATRIPLLG